MSFSSRVLAQLSGHVSSVWSCFDRVIFKGYLPFHREAALNSWVDSGLRVRRTEFVKQLERRSEELVEHAKACAQVAGRSYEYRQGQFDKAEFIQQIVRRDGITTGLVAVLCAQEVCRTVKLAYGEQRPRLVFAKRPQRVLYTYYIAPDFGILYIRLETWFPDTIQVYVNGHDWLARQMTQRGLGFVQEDNCFTQLDDPEQAQALADRFAQLHWIKQLSKWARQVNPHITKGGWLECETHFVYPVVAESCRW